MENWWPALLFSHQLNPAPLAVMETAYIRTKLFSHQLNPAPLALMETAYIRTKLFTKSVRALAWAIFSSRDAFIWLLLTCLARLCRSVHTGPLLCSPCSERTWHKSSTVKRYTLDADKTMQHNNNPQEPMTETELPNRPLAMITTGSAWVKPLCYQQIYEPLGSHK